MRRTEVVALGLLQGPAELLPVSSSGHVAALPWLLGWEHAQLEGARRKEVEVALHAGGAVALVVGLRRELMALRIDVAVLSLLPAVALAFAAERWIETRLGGPRSLAARAGGGVGRARAGRPRAAGAPGGGRGAPRRAAARARAGVRARARRLALGRDARGGAGAGVRAARRGAALARHRRPGAGRGGGAEGAAADPAAPRPRGARHAGAGRGAPPAARTLAALPLARTLESGRPLAPWAAYRCVLAGVLLVRDNRAR